MPGKLVIVESPAKAKTLKRYLGSGYTIKATMGHVRDLPEKELAVDIENDFAPKYILIPSKKKAVDELKRAASTASEILIATDPDREGEAIGWHIAYLLNRDGVPIHRVMFNEITKQAVQEAVANPGKINQKKVDAQQARRVLDRLVGYLVSQQLWKVIARGLSAGRVQSVALRLIVEREEQIEAFVPEEYWLITASAKIEEEPPFTVKLVKMAGSEAKIDGGEQAEGVLDDLRSLPSRVHEVRHNIKPQSPGAPFTTSTMQQEAARRLSFAVRRTMSVAQRLYEGIELGDAGAVGLITYMRTDSTRVAGSAVASAREFIANEYGPDYLCPKPRVYKKKGRTQDAHEAIRPTSTKWTPKKIKPFIKPDQFRLYELIWNRFMATQMADAIYESVSVDVAVGRPGDVPAGFEKGAPDEPPYLLRASDRRLLFPGFRRLWGEQAKENGNGNGNGDEGTELPDIFFPKSSPAKGRKIAVGIPVTLDEIDGEQKFTQPQARYSESTLVKTLDEKGIGRPSTYAQIISTILDRKYIERGEKRRLIPTELGRTVNGILVSEFDDVFNVAFTAKMERALDDVEEGGDWTETVRKFWEPFKHNIDRFQEKRGELKEKTMVRTGRKCPKCGEGELVERWGRYGKFVACDNYPKCKYVEKNSVDQNGEARIPQSTGRACPECGEGELVIRAGRYGKFAACNRYPKCRYTEKLPGEEKDGPGGTSGQPKFKIPCPREGCGGKIISKSTRSGKIMYGCTNWKAKGCKVAFWDQPVESQCPRCDYPLRVVKGEELICPECKHREPKPEESSDA